MSNIARCGWALAVVMIAGCSGGSNISADGGPGLMDATDRIDGAVDAGLPDGSTTGDTGCNDVATDPRNCGACSHDCTVLPGVVASRVSCVAGVCIVDAACVAGRAHCTAVEDDGCETDVTTATNCGSCGTACAEPTPLCSMGSSGPYACASGCSGMTPTRCERMCVETTSDVNHCGSCTNACPMVAFGTATCTGGVCGFRCSAGLHACSGSCVSNTDVATCGTACAPCPTVAGGSATCDGTTCGIACNPGFHLCGATCVSNADVAHCGTSCTSCPPPPPNATTICDGVSCGPLCIGGFHLCDGACVTNASTMTCGASCTPCPAMPNATVTCDGVACGSYCNPGFHLCGGACVSNMDVATCGTSCSPCAPPANGTSTCNGTSCGISCNAGFHLCAGVCVSNTALSTCGASCSACSVPVNGSATCDGTSCGVACNSGYHACGAACGSDTSPATCGSSCTACPAPASAMATCTSGACGYTCNPGFASCGGGCGCGAGCTTCPARANASATCSMAGACGFTCNAGFADCDGNAANGCETAALGAGNSILFCDSFETGLGNWTPDVYWSQAACGSCTGLYDMRGTAGSTSSACDRGGSSSMALDVSLATATSATLYYRSWATVGVADSMAVYVSTTGGASWSFLASAPRTMSWLQQSVSLAAYLGRPAVRIRFQFYNGCPDCCGVDWYVDNVIIEAR